MLSSLYWVLDIVYKRREKEGSRDEGREREGKKLRRAIQALLCSVWFSQALLSYMGV